ncbi:uncharacterized protein LOC129577620 [Sitodiplosis mosellana]|uniref:uncharacterized protein LOC129577620 n=1 Tax=Sitodiplosis mosellana TaxID=263140 RepID=UPI0024444897|nr:uncharacterized protein LOC129577620 [Sitodiplosis mosellana]
MENEPKSVQQIKSKFNEICTPFVNQMSDKLVTSLNDIIKPTNKTLKLKQFEDKFKADMIKKWHEEFDTLWETKQLEQRLTKLNELKQQHKPKGPNEKAWRAHGHTAEQQTQHSRNRQMSVHLLKMRELLSEQSNELQKMILEVEQRRNYFNDLSKRRGKVIEEMDAKLVELQPKLIEADE